MVLLWGSEIQANLDFEWSKECWFANGLDLFITAWRTSNPSERVLY